MKLRTHLLLIVLASVLPLFIFAIVMVVDHHQVERDVLQRSMLNTARALSAAVDRELEGLIRALKALATSEHLDSGDLKSFYNAAKRVLSAQQSWENVLLIDASGQQVMNLRLPFDPRHKGLTQTIDPELLERVVQTRKPAISNLFFGPIAKMDLVGVAVPVIRDGAVKYVLRMSTSSKFLTDLLSKENIPHDRLATIIDRNQVIIARSRDVDKFLGRPASPTFAAKSKESQEAMWSGVTLEGTEVFSALKRSDLSGWTVGLGVPASVINEPLKRSLLIFAGGGLVLLLGGIALAGFLSRRITAAIYTLSNTAEALVGEDSAAAAAAAASGSGRQIAEVTRVAEAIREATLKHKRAEEKLIKQALELESQARDLREAQRQAAVGRLAASVAHEVNNPLFAIKMQLSMLKSAADGPELVEKYNLVSDQLDRISRATQSLLGFFRQRTSPATTLSYSDVIRTVADLFESGLTSRGAALIRNIPDSLPAVSANVDGVQEVLINILENAREALGEGQKVSISAATEDHEIVIRVEDDGPGLGEDPEKLFQPYYTTKSGGTCLGLTIAREICEKNGGRLVAENRKEGGARFTIILPLTIA